MQSVVELSQQEIATRQIDEQKMLLAAHLFRLHGTLSVAQAYEKPAVEKMRDAFFDQYASRDMKEISETCLKVGDKRFMFTVRLEPPFCDPAIYANPVILPIVKEILGPTCVIQSFGAVCAYPGSEMQHYHRDHPWLFQEAGGLNAFLPPFALHVVIPLVDLTEDTGTTALWEGSHRSKSTAEESKYSKAQIDRLEGAAMPYPSMGDCYFMDFRLRHRGTANRSNIARPILYLVYSRGWFDDERNYREGLQEPLLISKEELARVPAEYKFLFARARPD